MVPHFPGAHPRTRIKRDDSIGATGNPGSSVGPHRPGRWASRRTVVAACCVLISVLAGLTAGGPAARAEPDPDAQKKKLDQQVKASLADLHESYNQLQGSVLAFDQATVQLSGMQKRYAAAQGELAAARAADQAAAVRLRQAEAALTTARNEVVAGEQQIAKSRRGIGRVVRSAYQQHSELVGLSLALRGSSPAELATGFQVQRNVFGVQSNAMADLRSAQAQLANKQAKVAEAERILAAERAEAAEMVRRVAAMTLDVAARKLEVTKSAQTKLRAYYRMANDRAAELNRYYQLANERNRVTRIMIARARAERAAMLKRRAEAIRAEREKARREGRKERPVPPSWGNELFIRPVDTYITSPYGMRFHPILHYWKLHDGTDFGGGCGTPIRASAGGVVTDKYYNGGYGKRLFVSHGFQRGHHLVSVYNHLSSYSAYVGERVRKGEVIGYVGTTGYSTGCHLHFMIYQDGHTVNPMKWV